MSTWSLYSSNFTNISLKHNPHKMWHWLLKNAGLGLCTLFILVNTEKSSAIILQLYFPEFQPLMTFQGFQSFRYSIGSECVIVKIYYVIGFSFISILDILCAFKSLKILTSTIYQNKPHGTYKIRPCEIIFIVCNFSLILITIGFHGHTNDILPFSITGGSFSSCSAIIATPLTNLTMS